ncbi:MAG: DUF2142 domain-containing protein [Candidatus Latescibacteria bacterium]|nr:DUF2142 domain-containing protein [bacterium]MBD3425120.1 DUF2142 domain-containing protein [Candidatus Latescibacterota bacterium]
MNRLPRIFKRHRWLAGILLISLIIRLGAVLSMPAGINWKDGLEYDSFAASLENHHAYLNQYGAPSAYRPPGYPVFLLLAGRNPTVVRILQSLLGAVTVLLVYLIAIKLAGRAEAVLAAAVTAVYPLYIYSAGTYYPAVLLSSLLPAVFLLLISARRTGSGGKALAAGFLAGLIALTKGSFLPAFALAAVWLAADRNRHPQEVLTEEAKRATSRIRPALLFVIPILILTGIWGFRNYHAVGSFRPLSTNSGYNFWLGNYPGVKADTGNRKLPGQREQELAIRSSNRGEVETDRAFLRKGFEHVRDNPRRFVTLSISKFLNFWRLYPSPMSRELKLWEKLISALSYGPVLILGLYFLFTRIRRMPEARLILLIFIGYTAVHALFISKVRLRLPLDTLLIICGAAGFFDLAGRLGLRSRR